MKEFILAVLDTIYSEYCDRINRVLSLNIGADYEGGPDTSSPDYDLLLDVLSDWIAAYEIDPENIDVNDVAQDFIDSEEFDIFAEEREEFWLENAFDECYSPNRGNSLQESALEEYPEATFLIEGLISMLRKKNLSKNEIKKLFDDRLSSFR